ncbi:MAG: DUF2800 domain-containing protein [Acidaminococcaceae bacterium]
MKAHAFLSASGSKRWLACPPSAAFESQFKDKGSIFAAEGTDAHELAELYLRHRLGEITDVKFNAELHELQNASEYYSPEMEDNVAVYVDTVMQKYAEAQKLTPDAMIIIEGKLDFSPWVPKGFGTGDAVIIADGRMEIIDLKYGKGVPVSAEDNSQLRLYALGAYNSFGLLYAVDAITTTIVQPRLDSISSESLSLGKLLEWGEGVKGVAEMAIKGEGEFCAGKHCQFCKAAVRCKALADYNLEIAQYEFAHADELNDEDIADILSRADMISKWLKAVSDYALDEAVNNSKVWLGYKLVEGRSNRIIVDREAAVKKLKTNGFEDVYKPQELKGITELEKLTGKKKFTELLAGLIDKPQGKPTLVPESDKRPVWQPENTVEEDFKEEI